MAVYKLEDIAIIKSGGDLPKIFSLNKTKINKFLVLGNGINKKSILGYSNNWKINKNNITISARGTIGHVQWIKENFTPCIRLIVILGNEDIVLKKYLYYKLLRLKFPYTGAVQKQLTKPIVSKIKIKIPNLKTQKQIIDIIEPIEKMIYKTNLITKNITKYIKFFNVKGKLKNKIIFQTSKGKILKNLEGENRYFNNSKNIYFCRKDNNGGEALIVTTRGTLTTHIAFDNWYSTNNIYILRGKGIFSNKKNIENMIKTNKRGSTIPMISKSDIINSLKPYNEIVEKNLRNLFFTINLLLKLVNKLENIKKKLINLLLK